MNNITNKNIVLHNYKHFKHSYYCYPYIYLVKIPIINRMEGYHV